ncbi:hypothetical protein OROGR_027844 [Orobanche gracilis]
MEASGSDMVEETSPDMLKNTPLNIRRLANEIEQCEGRQKYLAHTRSPSDGGDVRWYFCKIPLGVNELAASVPRTEIVGRGDYFRFGMRDSLAIEASFLQKEDELLSSWWKEYAECSEGPSEQPINSKSSQQLSLESPQACQLFTTEEERVGVPVKGGLYETPDLAKYLIGSDDTTLDFVDSLVGSEVTTVDLFDSGVYYTRKVEWSEEMEKRYLCFLKNLVPNGVATPLRQLQILQTNVDLVKRHCFPVYWNGENRRVLRGHWFARKGGLDWLPLREDVSEQLEYAFRSQVWHRRTFQPSGLFAARIDLQGSTTGLHALFTGEDDTWEAWLSVDACGFSGVISLGRNGIKLRRGYAPAQSKKPTQAILLYL